MSAIVLLSTHTPEKFAHAVHRAAELLRAGEVVALPTETVYGLAANALNAAAVAKIYEIKGRPAHNPIIVHADGIPMAKSCVADWPQSAERAAKNFWPGPLTLVLPRARNIPDIVTAGGDTVGVRWPAHPFMAAVIRECGFPLAAPSANLSNQISPTTAEHVMKSLGDKLKLIVDGGASQVGIESTVLDLTVQPPRVLRPGMIHDEALFAVMGDVSGARDQVSGADGALRSPGLLRKHYSPRAKLVILRWNSAAELASQLSTLNSQPSRVHIIARTPMAAGTAHGQVSLLPHEPAAFASAIYAALHRCDEAGAALIVVEALPESPEWAAIKDRLNRAAAD